MKIDNLAVEKSSAAVREVKIGDGKASTPVSASSASPAAAAAAGKICESLELAVTVADKSNLANYLTLPRAAQAVIKNLR
jgi:hypothetical protein